METYRKSLDIKEFYPEKNPHECKIKKEYGNKAYQDGKDIDALHFYTQVIFFNTQFGKSAEIYNNRTLAMSFFVPRLEFLYS